MFVQQGAFAVHDAKGALNTRRGHSRYLRPLLIPASAVRAVARQVYASGFRHGDLVPDLSNLADELTGKP